MEEINRQPKGNLSLAPENVKELVDTKEKVSQPPKKTRSLPWIILSIGIFILFIGLGFLVRNIIQTNQKPDLYINAPDVIYSSATPTPSTSEEVTKLVPQDILFESQPYQNNISGFSINIPQGWKVDESGTSGAVVVLIDPKVTLAASSSALLTFVSVTSGAPEVSMTAQIKSAKDGLQRQYTSYNFDEDQDILINGLNYHLLGGTYPFHGVTMRNRNLIIISNGHGYAISATAPESAWPKKELILNATLFSFKFI